MLSWQRDMIFAARKDGVPIVYIAQELAHWGVTLAQVVDVAAWEEWGRENG